jgi:hypothetical protein
MASPKMNPSGSEILALGCTGPRNDLPPELVGTQVTLFRAKADAGLIGWHASEGPVKTPTEISANNAHEPPSRRPATHAVQLATWPVEHSDAESHNKTPCYQVASCARHGRRWHCPSSLSSRKWADESARFAESGSSARRLSAPSQLPLGNGSVNFAQSPCRGAVLALISKTIEVWCRTEEVSWQNT